MTRSDHFDVSWYFIPQAEIILIQDTFKHVLKKIYLSFVHQTLGERLGISITIKLLKIYWIMMGDKVFSQR